MKINVDYSLDSMNQIGMMNSWHKFWKEAFEKEIPSFDRKEIEKIIFIGMGGSAIAGNYISAVFSNYDVDLIVHKNYGLPKTRLSKKSLIIASSYSGNTEETISGVLKAKTLDLPMVIISTGGEMEKISNKYNIPFVSLPKGLAPRASLAAMLPISGQIVQETLSYPKEFRKGFSGELEKIAKKQPSPFVEKIIDSLKNTLPIILGAEHTFIVGLRFRAQLNENSKKHAFSFELPEHNHNAIVPIGIDLNELIHHVLIIDKKRLPERINYRFEFIKKFLEEKKLENTTIEMPNNGTKIEDMLKTTYELDYASIFLALIRKIDPNPVETITKLKEYLSLK